MKIYTRKGDQGFTQLANGQKVSKSHIKMSLCGTLDEFNSTIGLAISFLPKTSKLQNLLQKKQNKIFDLGAEFTDFQNKQSIILDSDISYLESKIDQLSEELPPLRNFILPGGSKSASFLHLARSIARRLERLLVQAKENQIQIHSNSLIYINRLSDFLFVAARFANIEENYEEVIWKN